MTKLIKQFDKIDDNFYFYYPKFPFLAIKAKTDIFFSNI